MTNTKSLRLAVGAIFTKGPGKIYFYRYQVDGRRKTVSLQTSNRAEALKKAQALIPIVKASTPEIVAAHVEYAKGFKEAERNLCVTDIWDYYSHHPERAIPATIHEKLQYQSSLQEFLDFLNDSRQEVRSITPQIAENFSDQEFRFMSSKITFEPDRSKAFRIDFELPEERRRDGEILIDRPGLCRVEVRKIGSCAELAEFEKLENYAGRTPSPDDLALEAELFLTNAFHPEWRSLRIGIPLADCAGITGFSVIYSIAAFQLTGGGKVLAEEFPFGDPPAEPGEDAAEPQPWRQADPVIRTQALHTWSPEGLNDWVGDVALGAFNGEIHLFYLLDHRHHKSKFHQGGHSWAHLTTRDFKNWRDDGVILPIDEQWKSYGTGTPFELNGKLALAYGFHTERFLPEGVKPEGASWAVSDDGQHFVPSGAIFDETRNPSIYNRPDGSFLTYRGYAAGWLKLLRAQRWPEFTEICSAVVPSGDESPSHNCLDCPAYFEWHGRCYIIVGFCGMWMATRPDFADRVELAAAGKSVYDGLCVPMVVPYQDNRRLLAGWLPMHNLWGGILGIRELVWFDDGILGVRWFDDAMPKFDRQREFSVTGGATAKEFMLEMELSPGKEFTLTLGGGQQQMHFGINAVQHTATLPEAAPDGQMTAISHLRGVDAPFGVRVMVRDERKWAGAVVDIEIAGCRTLMRHYPRLHVDHCTLRGAVRNAVIRENI